YKYFNLIQYENEYFEKKEFVAVVKKINQIKMDMSLSEVRNYYNQILMEILQKKKNIEYDPLCITSLEYKIKSIICNLDDLLKSLDQMINIIERLIKETKFSKLYDGSKNLFSIGYDCENNQMTSSYYDLMASESRITSYISVVTKQVPPEHWYKLSRTFTLSHHHRALASWSGTMFEYFMPSLILNNYEYSIFDETYHSVIIAQQRYSEAANRPWGVSESAYYFFDLDLNYQYKAFGVPDLGFKRGLINDYVVSPYSTYFALNFDKDSSIKNLKLLREENASGIYGLYESIDYSKQRVENDGDKKVVKAYMAHHLGMSLLSINNFINDNIMQRRFHSEPIVQTGEFLLQEKTPYRISIIKELKEKQRKVVELKRKEIVLTRVYSDLVEGLPECHMISNKHYHVMITNTGVGYSQFQDKMVTRFRSDLKERFYGYTFFFKNITDNNVWTIGSEPISSKFKDYEVIFSLNKAEIIRKDNQITTHVEIWVSPEDDVEIRQITFFNNSNKTASIETTSYAELVLNNQSADITHPAFSNLFISTSYDKETESLIAVRKPRNPDDKETYIFKTMVCEGKEFGFTQYETNRSSFIGRGRTLENPIAIEKVLANTEGVVLEPILSLRKCVNIEPHQKSTLTYIMGVTDSHSKTKELINKYKNSYVIKDQLDLSAIQTQVEMNYLDLNVSELKIFLDMIPELIYLNPNRRKFSSIIQNNKLGQTSLWKYGISGDLPIILATINSIEHIDNIWTLIKAKEFWKLKGINTDLIILNNQESSYFNDVEEEINEMISKKFGYHSNVQSLGIFIMNNKTLHDEDRNLLYASANIIIDCDKNKFNEQIKLSHQYNVAKKRKYENCPYENINYAAKKFSLKYFNGYGGFNIDKKEYVIRLHDNTTTPAPWINVISNENFGFIVSENGGGFTWSENSNENKLTPWLNDTIFNIPQEVIYVKDEKYGKLFSLTPDPLGENIDYDVVHGKGYSKFFSRAYLLENELTLSVPLHDKVKIYRIKIMNNSDETRKLSYFFSVAPVLGVHREITKKYIITKFIDDKYLMITNPYNHQYPNRKMYISSSEPIISYSGDSFEINQHDLYRMNNLSNRVGAGLTPCGTLQVSIEINANEEKELIFILGQEQTHDGIMKQIEKYSSLDNVDEEYERIHNYWDGILNTIKVRTPDHKFDEIMNSWLPYQSISCRLNARSAFYQTGGAYGYRDQLQDAVNMLSIDPKLAKKQILLNAAHQFPEGDVLHWWHPGDIEKGIRTRFSDDLLWLPYAVSEYLLVTEDYSILDLKTPYVIGELLKEDEKEVYFTPSVSDYQETIYDHCIKAINHSLKYGQHGIPLMGGGDWNDGMNEVGVKGKGESVWLGWFLSLILDRFIIVSHQKNDSTSKEKFTEHLRNIVDSLEKNAWDGSWYKRAFYDDGTPLGSIVNSECMIDSLSQSWAVISGHAYYERSVTAMNSVRNHLILKDKGMILLFTPPFDKTKKNPGYIKSYAKGVRENGGQYTHAASWVINAFALLGEGNKAFELLQMLNPINQSPSIFRANNYKVEPYVIPADIYNVTPHVGRGGWTWYTGAAGWMYRVGIESILGFKKRGDKLFIAPCIPNNWQSYKIEYRYKNTLYIINIINNEGISRGSQKYTLDGNLLETDYIKLIDDHIAHQIEVSMHND
ncbi:MAG: glucoamylase family protein, partial [Bacillota bacterium]|nr:glucoamylase family protein [Bacillota bacterium]